MIQYASNPGWIIGMAMRVLSQIIVELPLAKQILILANMEQWWCLYSDYGQK
jgi:hypothetical protein